MHRAQAGRPHGVCAQTDDPLSFRMPSSTSCTLRNLPGAPERCRTPRASARSEDARSAELALGTSPRCATSARCKSCPRVSSKYRHEDQCKDACVAVHPSGDRTTQDLPSSECVEERKTLPTALAQEHGTDDGLTAIVSTGRLGRRVEADLPRGGEANPAPPPQPDDRSSARPVAPPCLSSDPGGPASPSARP